jgi:hypoxanthine phosphoribosyltransferase
MEKEPFNNFQELNNYSFFFEQLNSSQNLYKIENYKVEEEFEKTKKERFNEDDFYKKINNIQKILIDKKLNIIYNPSYVSFLSWDNIYINFDKISNNPLKNNIIFDIDLIIGIKTGGYYLAHYFKYFIKEKLNKNVDITSCKIKRLIEDKTNLNDTIIYDDEEYLQNKLENKNIKILIMDDLVRHGFTMINIINNLTTNYNIKKENIYTFSIFDSPLYHTSLSFNELYQEADFIRLFCAPWGFDT